MSAPSKNNADHGNRIAFLEGLRGTAILMVLFHHAVFIFSGLEAKSSFEISIWKMSYNAAAGVDLFFLLSGFLITRILLKEKGSPGYYKNFYTRRMLRIFPLYYLYLAFAFLVIPLLPNLFWPPVRDSISPVWYFTYLANLKMFFDKIVPTYYLSHMWSLAIEEQFYLVWPFIIALFPLRTLKKILPAIIFFSLVTRLYLEGMIHASPWQIRIFTLARFDILALGAWLAILYGENLFTSLTGTTRKAVITAACLLLVSFLSLLSGIYPRFKESFSFSQTGIIFAYVMFFLFASAENSITRKIFASKFLTAFGKYSYSIYLFHMGVGMTLSKIFLPMLKTYFPPLIICGAFFILMSGISFGIGWITYHLYEIHFLKLKDKLAPVHS